MKYLLLIYDNPANPLTDSELAAVLAGHATLYQELSGTGEVVSSASLADSPAATTVRVRDGESAITDGPFLEAKEHLAGYYLVRCDDLERAIEIATRIPCGAGGAVEIRPVNEEVTDAVRGENR